MGASLKPYPKLMIGQLYIVFMTSKNCGIPIGVIKEPRFKHRFTKSRDDWLSSNFRDLTRSDIINSYKDRLMGKIKSLPDFEGYKKWIPKDCKNLLYSNQKKLN